MIFVTVGTQLPFDRMVDIIDEWALNNPSVVINAQVGPTKKSFSNIKYCSFMSPEKIEESYIESDLIVAHAGMGSILTAMRLNRPIIVFPRLATLGEHRNDHQISTVAMLGKKNNLNIATDKKSLIELLDNREKICSASKISSYANSDLIENIKYAIHK